MTKKKNEENPTKSGKKLTKEELKKLRGGLSNGRSSSTKHTKDSDIQSNRSFSNSTKHTKAE